MLQLNGHRHRLTVTQQAKLDFAADRHGAHLGTQRGKAADRLTVQSRNHVAGLNARLSGRRVRHHLADESAALSVDFHRFRQFGVQLGPHDTQLTAFNLAKFDHLIGQVFHHVARNREADTNVTAVRRQNRGVDTDQLAVEVNQRAAGVTAVNRRIGLDKVFIIFNVQAATT